MADSSDEERIQRIERNDQLLDDSDEGFESGSNTSDFGDIVICRKYPLPTRPPLHVMDSSDEEEEREAARGGRRSYDRYRRRIKNVSRGDDDDGNRGAALRNILRKTRTNGHGISDSVLEAKRITGMSVTGGRIVYFVQWSNNGKDSHPLDEHLMRWGYPEMVIEFHENSFIKSTKYMNL